MTKKAKKNKLTIFDDIEFQRKHDLPLTIWKMNQADPNQLIPKQVKSSFHQTEGYYCVLFYKCMSKLRKFEV